MDIVKQIKDALKSEVQTALPVDFQELQFIYNIEANTSRNIVKGYGVKLLDASNIDLTTRAYTLDQRMEIILTNTAGRQSLADETDLVQAIDELYDYMDDVLNQVFLTKLGLPNIVILIGNPSYSEVELLTEGSFVILRMQIDIRYRRFIQ